MPCKNCYRCWCIAVSLLLAMHGRAVVKAAMHADVVFLT